MSPSTDTIRECAREALGWFGVWTGLALLFNLGVVFFHERGLDAGLEFFTGFSAKNP